MENGVDDDDPFLASLRSYSRVRGSDRSSSAGSSSKKSNTRVGREAFRTGLRGGVPSTIPSTSTMRTACTVATSTSTMYLSKVGFSCRMGITTAGSKFHLLPEVSIIYHAHCLDISCPIVLFLSLMNDLIRFHVLFRSQDARESLKARSCVHQRSRSQSEFFEPFGAVEEGSRIASQSPSEAFRRLVVRFLNLFHDLDLNFDHAFIFLSDHYF